MPHYLSPGERELWQERVIREYLEAVGTHEDEELPLDWVI